MTKPQHEINPASTPIASWTIENSTYPEDCDPVGQKVRQIRAQRNLGLRDLAKKSGLSTNTLCLIENGKSSPTVSTLQRLAHGLEVPISAFFETEPIEKQVVYTPGNERPHALFRSAHLENLGKDLAGNAVQPFVVKLPPKAGSGTQMIVHTGHEFVYCLAGVIGYRIDQTSYRLNAGDSLVFESHLPHRWENLSDGESQMILILFHADQLDKIGGFHLD